MNINEINDYIIEVVESYYSSYSSDLDFNVTVNHVLHITVDEFNDLSKTKLVFQLNLTKLRFAVIQINTKKYFIIIGTDELHVENTDLKNIKIDNVIFLSVVKNLRLNIREGISYIKIKDDFYPKDEGDNSGYDLIMLINNFEPFIAFEILDPELVEQENIDEVKVKNYIARLLLNNKKYLYLDFEVDTIKAYMSYFNDYYDDNILNSSIAYCWRYCFLDVYRCIEPIFRYIPLSQLKEDIKFHGSIDDLYDKIHNSCGWRPQEYSSMEILFERPYLSEELIKKLKSIGDRFSGGENLGKSIYKLRNQIVHHQGSSSNIETSLSIEEWNKLIEYMLEVLVELSIKFQNKEE
jgi:hypothetical protein